MAEVVGTKDLVEAIDAIAALAKAGLKVAKDGKIDIADLSVLIDLGKQYDVLVAGFADFEKIPAEVKDLSLEEAQAVILKLLAALADVKAA